MLTICSTVGKSSFFVQFTRFEVLEPAPKHPYSANVIRFLQYFNVKTQIFGHLLFEENSTLVMGICYLMSKHIYFNVKKWKEETYSWAAKSHGSQPLGWTM